MKIYNLFLATVSLCVFTACENANKKIITVKTEIYCDHCKECESCKPQVEAHLREIDGVLKAEMNVDTKTITVEYDENKTDVEKVKIAITQSGYSADEMPPSSDAYDNLDDCCKKK